MVSLLQAILLGIVQGITEWFPISSSGHLVLVQLLFGIDVPVVFDVALHVGSLLALLVLFWRDLFNISVGFFQGKRDDQFMVLYLVLGTIPVVIVGLFFKEFLESSFSNIWILGVGFLVNALFLFLIKGISGNKDISYKSSLVIGVAQAASILSSISRSGLTVASGLLMGIRRDQVARFVFLLAIPALFGAAILEIPNLKLIESIPIMLVGVLVSFVVGYLSLKWLVSLIKHGKFYRFAWYNLVLGIVVLLWLLLF